MAGPFNGAARSVAAVAALLLLLAVSVTEAATGSTVVARIVFCDQCKDDTRGLFDYPLYGTRVRTRVNHLAPTRARTRP